MNGQKDMRAEKINTMAALGESSTWGYTVSDKKNCWVNRLGAMIQKFQGKPVNIINQGIGSNVLTKLCPSYKYSNGAAAIDRINGDIIKYDPELIILSYGLNDSRGGTQIRDYIMEYQKLIDIIKQSSNAVIVLVNTYYMHEYLYTNCPNWEQSDYNITEIFNLALKQLADNNDLIYADIYSAEVGVDWIIDDDHCHPNDLGHFLIANRIFEAIVRNCSFTAATMPRKSIIKQFGEKYGNGPDNESIKKRADGI